MDNDDPFRFGTDPESVWEAELDTIHRAEHIAARGVVLLGRINCKDCKDARVKRILERQ